MLPILPLILGLAPEIARWVGGSQSATVATAVATAVKAVTGTDDPDAAAAALAGDAGKTAELRVKLAEIAAAAEAAQRQADLEEIKAQFAADAAARQAQLDTFRASIADMQSARSQTTELASVGSRIAWTAPTISGIILVAFGIMIYVVLQHRDQGVVNSPLANVLLGTLAAMATQVANYWLGSSSGSKGKDAIIRDAQVRLAEAVPPSMTQGLVAVAATAAATQAAAGLSTDGLNAMSLSRARRE